MTIRILIIVAVLIMGIWLSYITDLSLGGTIMLLGTLGSAVALICGVTPMNLSEYITETKTYNTSVVSTYVASNDMQPVLLAASIQPIVVPARSSYSPDCYVAVSNGDAENIVFSVSRADYGKYLKGDVVTVTYYYIGNAIYNITLDGYSCKNTLALRDANIFTQQRLLKEALWY